MLRVCLLLCVCVGARRACGVIQIQVQCHVDGARGDGALAALIRKRSHQLPGQLVPQSRDGKRSEEARLAF